MRRTCERVGVAGESHSCFWGESTTCRGTRGPLAGSSVFASVPSISLCHFLCPFTLVLDGDTHVPAGIPNVSSLSALIAIELVDLLIRQSSIGRSHS